MGVGTQGTLSICRLQRFSLAVLGPNDIRRGRVPKKPRCQMVGHGGYTQAVMCSWCHLTAAVLLLRPQTDSAAVCVICLGDTQVTGMPEVASAAMGVTRWRSVGRSPSPGRALGECLAPCWTLGLWEHRQASHPVVRQRCAALPARSR